MLSYSVFLPSYSVGEDCYQQIPYVTRKYGKTAVVIGGKTAMEKARQELDAAVQGSDVQILDYIWYGGDSNYENVEMLKADSRVQEADMLFGVGGGRACDTVKTLADMLDKPFLLSRHWHQTVRHVRQLPLCTIRMVLLRNITICMRRLIIHL